MCGFRPKNEDSRNLNKMFKIIRLRRKNTIGSDGRNFSLTYFYEFSTRLKKLGMLFHPRHYNLTSENILN